MSTASNGHHTGKCSTAKSFAFFASVHITLLLLFYSCQLRDTILRSIRGEEKNGEDLVVRAGHVSCPCSK
jgi:hypothetical protein